MRRILFAVCISFVLYSIPQSKAAPQTAQNLSASPPLLTREVPAAPALKSAQKDATAINILNQAIAAAGGVAQLKAISDYTATGSVTYYQGTPAQGSVTLRGRGAGYFRRDTTLPTGPRSWTMVGRAASQRDERGRVRTIRSQSPMSTSAFVIPSQQLVTALNWPQLRVLYQGLSTVDGRSVHDVRIQRVPLVDVKMDSPHIKYTTIDFFIDASTFQVVMTQEAVANGIFHQIRYSGYSVVNGVAVPFSIQENLAGQEDCLIQLTQISTNSGLSDSDFEF